MYNKPINITLDGMMYKMMERAAKKLKVSKQDLIKYSIELMLTGKTSLPDNNCPEFLDQWEWLQR